MSDVLSNPVIVKAVNFEEKKDILRAMIAPKIISEKKWTEMMKDEKDLCMHYIVSSSNSKDEVENKLKDLGAGCCSIAWSDVDPDDQTSLEAQALIRSMGGLVSQNGALVNIDFF